MPTTACPTNLLPRGRRGRLTLGVGMLLLSAAVLAVLLLRDEPRVWRLALFVPLWIGGLGLFQGLAST